MRHWFKKILLCIGIFGVVGAFSQLSQRAETEDEINTKIEAALYTRTEFFGASAIVAYPTAEARNRLEDLSKQYPNPTQVYLNLSQLEEKLGNYEKAEFAIQRYTELNQDKEQALNQLADYRHRRAEFEKEADTLFQLITIAKPLNKAAVFERLFNLAGVHRFEKYLAPETYQKLLAEDSNAFQFVQSYIEKLIEQKSYTDALNIITKYKSKFPEQSNYFLSREVSVLESTRRINEAITVYHTAFNPFWSDEESSNYYQFLSGHDRLYAYGAELKERFRNDPTNFDTAVRLYCHFATSNHYNDNHDIFPRLEKARAKQGVAWKSDELATAARLMIRDGDGDTASRFLYTLYTNGELKKGSELRAKILYQLFELFIDAENERLALTRGDLQFYADVAKSDPNPGIIGGVLSMLFSDTNPQRKLDSLEEKAVKHFNRSAAFRIFTAYKEEYPTSPELAQMYLDVVRLYASNKDVDISSQTLGEFEQRYGDAKEFPEVALKLADAYSALGRREEEKAIYQKILDYFGQHKKEGEQLVQSAEISEPTTTSPQNLLNYPFNTNQGTTAAKQPVTTNNNYSYNPTGYSDFIGDDAGEYVSYQNVLARYVSMLNQEKRTADIIALYANEVKKYPNEEGLYEQWLIWLGQANLVDEQLGVYKEALKRFGTSSWNDRMARWFLYRKRQHEFESFSRELLAKMNDAETESYLSKFVDEGASASPEKFQAQLYIGFYSLAHKRFPHNLTFVHKLLKYHSINKQETEWRQLMAEYYFESASIRQEFLEHLAGKNELRNYLKKARESMANGNVQNPSENISTIPYKLFRADASVWLSNYEEAIDSYRELNRLYPNTAEFSDRLISFTRSFGQSNRKFLEESASLQKNAADSNPTDALYRTRSGEIQAELGGYDRAKGEWEQLIRLGEGDKETYLNTATVYWDYFQYDDALRTIKKLREQVRDETLYAYQLGAIYEAKSQMQSALFEYAKGLDEDSDDYYQTSMRLQTLWERDGVPTQFQKAFNQVAGNDDLAVGYAAFLIKVNDTEQASEILKPIVLRSNNEAILERTAELFDEAKDTENSAQTLQRLSQISDSVRHKIWYRLRLANTLKESKKRTEAIREMRETVNEFPTNYGVLNEAVNFFWNIGSHEDALLVLQSSIGRAKGKYRYQFASKLAAKQIDLNRLTDAQKTLEWLHNENKVDSSVFRELARIYVRTNNPTALRRTFDETLTAIESQEDVVADKRREIADLRNEMITAFTRIKDFSSAIDQHIEIINRDPESEEKLDAAINYARRFGGAERLLVYYQKTAETAYKNYRWNIVLARIYEANGDNEKAVREYNAAIHNQPEMVELYDLMAHVYQRMKNYNAAVESLSKAVELSNDEPFYVKRLIEVLQQAGRNSEAEIARQKLPKEADPSPTLADKFRNAEILKATEKEKAVATYKEAINTILANPLKHDLKASEITGFVQTVSDKDGLQNTAQTLWTLREKLIVECAGSESMKARAQLQILDGAMIEAIGSVAVGRATGDELTALYADLSKRTDEALPYSDQYGTVHLLVNIASRLRFVELEEKFLTSLKEKAFSENDVNLYHTNLHSLVSFYAKHGDYTRILELLKSEMKRDPKPAEYEYYSIIAEYARLIDDKAQRLTALRENYKQAVTKKSSANDPLIVGYFSALLEKGDEGRTELRSLFPTQSPFHNQLIAFLLSKKESALAHEAINNARESKAWRLARNAETSLYLKNYEQENGNYFLQVLNYKNIGELITQKPTREEQAIGNDWFTLANQYGEWLYFSNKEKANYFLPAIVENRPQDADEQAKLGRWYLDKRDSKNAIEHLQIALEMKSDEPAIIADLGTAYFISGDKKSARELWESLINGEEVSFESMNLYLKTLTQNGLADEARTTLTNEIIASLNQYKFENYEDESYGRKLDIPKNLIRVLADSFEKKESGEAEKARYFLKLYESVPNVTVLPEMLIRESLIQRKYLVPFYRILIRESEQIEAYSYDYDFYPFTKGYIERDEAEEIFEHQNGFEFEESSAEALKYQHELLDLLIENARDTDASNLVAEIEKELNGKYVRPVWLRIAKARLLLRSGRKKEAVTLLCHLIGTETDKSVEVVKSPNIERLNEASSMLKREGFEADSLLLQEATYSRAIELGQYEMSSLIGLSKTSFVRGDVKTGLQILYLMIRLGDEETTANAESELQALPLIKSQSITETTIEQPEPKNEITLQSAISFSAETASEFGQIQVAIEFRKQLETVDASDSTNRLELAHLLSANGKTEEAIAVLTSLMNDRSISRSARWQALMLSREIIGEKKELWGSLSVTDKELATALSSFVLIQKGQTDAALSEIETSVKTNPNPENKFFYALMLKSTGHAEDALSVFNSLMLFDTAIAFDEENALRHAIRLNLELSRPFAALKLAESDNELKQNDGFDFTSHKFQMLSDRAKQKKVNGKTQLLEKLSQAAEQVKDFQLAIYYENLRLNLIINENEKRESEARLNRLREMKG